DYGASEADAPDDEMAHSHASGPNGGHIIEFADDHSIHGEFVLNETGATLYLTGSDMSTPVVAEEVVFDFEVEAADGSEEEIDVVLAAVDGKEGVYSAPADGLPTTDIEEAHGHFHITVAGEHYDGDLSHGHDGHDGHDHGDHEGHDHGDHDGHDHGDHEGHDHGDHASHDHSDHDHGDHEHGAEGKTHAGHDHHGHDHEGHGDDHDHGDHDHGHKHAEDGGAE
ncbi:MAG: hypothetical protein AAGJ97_04900, partial [Planctomycetota bacterium]